MALIIEVLDHRGSVIAFHRCDETAVTIGRSYENDIVLHDETVDAFHAIAHPQLEGGIELVDRGSVNGIALPKRKSTPLSSLRLETGDQVVLGRTRLRLVDSQAELEKAHSIKPAMPQWVAWLHSPWPIAVMCALLLSFVALENYASSYVELKLSDYLSAVFEEFAFYAVLIFVLGVISRLAKKHWNIQSNLTIILIVDLVHILINYLMNIVQFNVGQLFSSSVSSMIENVSYTLIFVWLVTHNLVIKKTWVRWSWVMGLAGFMAIYSITQMVKLSFDPSRFRPPMTTSFSSVVLPGVSVISEEAFIQQSSTLFNQSDTVD
jgi:pSer/pThr/pTyr-binding forkhead associated (FHA) protein